MVPFISFRLYEIITAIIISVLFLSISALYLIWPAKRIIQSRSLRLDSNKRYITFFHPFCASGGGGERVLWTAIQAILESNDQDCCLIYAASTHSNVQTLAIVKDQFGILIDKDRVKFLPLKTWRFLEAKRYPRLTLILSCLGSMVTGWEALTVYRPQIMIETVGYSFIYPLFKLFGSKVICYVHYPTISSDMLRLVADRTSSFNNSSTITSSKLLTVLKLGYYNCFSILYGFTGRFADTAVVNSSWTKQHVDEIWKTRAEIIYPPCDTKQLLEFPLENRRNIVVSIAQFRFKFD